MNAAMIELISGPVPTFSPSFAQLWVTPALIGLAWQMKFPCPHAPSRIEVAQPRARVVNCASTWSGGKPTPARVALTWATNDDSSDGVAETVAGTNAAKSSVHMATMPAIRTLRR